MSRSLEAIHQQLQCAVEGIVGSEEWKAMLVVASRFHIYSVNNQLLIFAQRPDATRVAGYRAWQRLGRQVRKGSPFSLPASVARSSRTRTTASRGS